MGDNTEVSRGGAVVYAGKTSVWLQLRDDDDDDDDNKAKAIHTRTLPSDLNREGSANRREKGIPRHVTTQRRRYT